MTDRLEEDRLVGFLIELNKDPKLAEKYKASPKEAAQEYGLDADDVKLLEENNTEEINKRLGKKGIEVKGMFLLNNIYYNK